MRYAMAKQQCLCCGDDVPFVPFKDPVCDTCSRPIPIVADELPSPAVQAKVIARLGPPPIVCSKEA